MWYVVPNADGHEPDSGGGREEHFVRAGRVAGNTVPGATSVNAFFDAVLHGDLKRVTVLLKGDPTLAFSKDNHAYTPLHVAAREGRKDVAELLLANKAEINVTDSDGDTPLHEAALNGHKDVTELLLTSKVKVNAENYYGEPSHGYPYHPAEPIVEEANVNAANNNGDTPLHEAALNGHKDVANLLLAHKADVNARNHKGDTPLHAATVSGHDEVAELLREYGGHD
jgi:ankyrin repeat protein